MKKMIQSKKFILSLIGLLAILLLLILERDLETCKWFSAFVVGIIGSFNIGQGLSDGLSHGKTSAGNG